MQVFNVFITILLLVSYVELACHTTTTTTTTITTTTTTTTTTITTTTITTTTTTTTTTPTTTTTTTTTPTTTTTTTTTSTTTSSTTTTTTTTTTKTTTETTTIQPIPLNASYYWSFDNTFNSYTGNVVLNNTSGANFTNDRFNRSNMAINLNYKYLSAPPGVYFSGDFTISAWIYLRNYNTWQKLIDFGNGPNSDNVVVSLSGNSNFTFHIIFVPPSLSQHNTNTYFPLNAWTHLTFTLQGTTSKAYLNGTLISTITNMKIPRNIQRTINYIGKSNWAAESLVNAIFDDIAIFNRSLTIDEIQNVLHYK